MLVCRHRLPPGGMDRLKTKFHDLNLNARLVQRVHCGRVGLKL